ncbi:MAG: hypothetical protein DME49_10770 [Verrucomicrobia bacterium]|nr:MAG: hypothetical protein DME49_10770 [Verrucomicrobiota bacterium]PYL57033.1 MAG: hypothetical protein DMF30_07770 [Verrucomicrobiota bacterium]
MIKMLIISAVFICSQAIAPARPCTTTEARKAEAVIARLDRWEDIYRSFKMYRQCDDGAVAEAFSNSIVRMCAVRWDQFDVLRVFASSDKDFYSFVLRHIDATAAKTDIERAIVNSTKNCPVGANNICSAIAQAAKRALRGMPDN